MHEKARRRVFVVDDEQIIGSTLAIILRGSGFTAEAFTNPLNALEQGRLDPPNLLISDVMMPEMSGIDLAISMREHHPSVKVLLFSGQAATVDLLEKARNNGHDFRLLSKPVHPTDLLAAIRQL